MLSLHYSKIKEKFGHVPALIATGPRDTGKTFSTNTSTSFIGMNAEKLCVLKDSTMSALRDRYDADPLPIILHDCELNKTVATVLSECFEGMDVIKHEGHWTPMTTISITCNEAQMNFLNGKRYPSTHLDN